MEFFLEKFIPSSTATRAARRARRVPERLGKSYLIEQFARENYEKYALFNLEEDPRLARAFDGNLDPCTVISNLSQITGHTLDNLIRISFPSRYIFPDSSGSSPKIARIVSLRPDPTMPASCPVCPCILH